MKPKPKKNYNKPISGMGYPGELIDYTRCHKNPKEFGKYVLFLKKVDLTAEQLEIYFRKFGIKEVNKVSLEENRDIKFVLEFETSIDAERVYCLFNSSYVPELESVLELSPDINNFNLFSKTHTKHFKIINISPNVTPLKLYHEFRVFGPIVNIITGQTSNNKNLGPAFILYKYEDSNQKALKYRNQKKFFKSIIYLSEYEDSLPAKIILTQHDRSNSSSKFNSPTELRSPTELPSELPLVDSKTSKKSKKKKSKQQDNKIKDILDTANYSEPLPDRSYTESPIPNNRPTSTSPIHDIIKSVKFQLPQPVTVTAGPPQQNEFSDNDYPPVIKRAIPGRLGHLRSKSYSYHANMDHIPPDSNPELPSMSTILSNQQKFVYQYLQSSNPPNNNANDQYRPHQTHSHSRSSSAYQQDLLMSHRKPNHAGFHSHSRHASLMGPALGRGPSYEDRMNFQQQQQQQQQQHLKGHLYVSNLPIRIDENALTQLFQPFGELTSVRVIKNEMGQPKGYGFVQFQKLEDAVKSMESLNQAEIDGNTLHVEFAASKSQKQAKLISQQSNMNFYYEKFNYSGIVELSHVPKEAISQILYKVIKLSIVHQSKLESVVSNLIEFYNSDIDLLLNDEEFLREKVTECYQLAIIRSKKFQPSVKLIQNINLIQQRLSKSISAHSQEEMGIKLFEFISCMGLNNPVDVCVEIMKVTQNFEDLIQCIQYQSKELLDLCNFLDTKF